MIEKKASQTLVYITTSRLPTEKAHGYQISRMCEAFAGHDISVTLLHPCRLQPDRALQQTTVFDYYGMKPVFQLHTLRNFDIFQLERFFPKKIFGLIFFMHSLAWGWYATRIARSLHADVYYIRDIPIAFWLVRFGLPTVYEAHSIPRGGQRWFLKSIAGHPKLKLTVALTSYLKKQLADIGFQDEKLIVLPDAVDEALFQGIEDRDACRRALQLPAGRPIIGYIGRFTTMEKEKGIEQLVEALRHISALHGLEPMLLCVGGPMDRVPRYRDIARGLGISEKRLRFVDRVPNSDVPRWIKACDVVTIPWPWNEFSAYFTSPMKLFEYMAAGVPIVASDLPSLRDVLRHGENAWLVQPGDPSALAAGITHVLANPDAARKLAEQARAEVKQFTWVKRADAVLKAL